MDPLQISELWVRIRNAEEDPLRRVRSRRPARERIIEAASYLFATRGLRFVTLDLIAERAETSTNYVIECFRSLEGVIANFLRHGVETTTLAYEEFWDALKHEYGRAADEQLRAWIRRLAPTNTVAPLPFSFEAMELADQPNHLGTSIISEHKFALRDELVTLCCDAFYRDPEVLADKLLMLVEGARIHAATFGGEISRARLFEATEDLFKRHWQSQ